MDCPPGQKSGTYREVVVSGGSTVDFKRPWKEQTNLRN